jgi:hypothetical protein
MGGGDPMSQLAAILQQALQICQGAAQPPQPPAPQAQNTAPVSGMRASAIEKIMMKAVMPLTLELKALKAKNAKLEQAQATKAAFLKAKKSLEGWELDEEDEARLMKAVQGGYADEIVALIQKTQPAEPFENAAQFEASLAEMPEAESAGVAKFLAENQGPKAQEWVRMQAREHAQHVARTGSDITLDAWLKTNAAYEKGQTPGSRPSPTTMRALMGN